MSGTTVPLRPLTLVEEGDEVLVGDPGTGTFVTMPAVGGVVISALLRGASAEEAAAEAEAFAGEAVDMPSFVATLTELGFVEDRPGEEREAVRTAPIQMRNWMAGVSSRLARPFFGRVAWTAYAALALFCVAVFVTSPSLFPSPAQDAFLLDDIGLGALLLMPFVMVSTALHECGHWLAARAIGVKSRFGVDRRIMLLVLETDLTQVWTVPRRRRYGPLLGGMAVDVTLLALLLGARLLIQEGWWHAPAAVDATLAVWVFLKLAGMLWQCMIFLRTDLYAVLVNALGCHNLWRVKTLLLRRAFGRLTAEQAAELDGAAPADLRAGRWFRWLWLAGFAGVLAWFVFFVVPVAVTVLVWAADGLLLGPLTLRFWYALLCAALLLGPQVLAISLAVKEYTRRAARIVR
ncbi:hypothetical protein FH608_007270 [Nonomuraea phyllanthi]|uniref:Uncharacterized protein n=1 Tax=Nonomuraea phyllanthi TaxID=2219224 RepID=A0A5C4WUF8_9ACTN|nr:hypothetical protein [Nonomuraea phyllanthi]KAB8196527.1 hypothetical protein FH608_007270 [Nonomuraea phyllanthi]QFY13757.1 hypothetical protein GBF35_50840 [Nonomuraea phyllanthi]